jgi:hypothetical protein
MLTVTPPTIGLSPTSLNFGNVTVGGIEVLTETVSNPGPSPLKISGISLKPGTGSDLIEFAFLGLCPPSLPAGKSCDIFVSFFADKAGVHDATLVLTDSGTGSPQKIPITGTGVKAGK